MKLSIMKIEAVVFGVMQVTINSESILPGPMHFLYVLTKQYSAIYTKT